MAIRFLNNDTKTGARGKRSEKRGVKGKEREESTVR
jgi:hypothetical protein